MHASVAAAFFGMLIIAPGLAAHANTEKRALEIRNLTSHFDHFWKEAKSLDGPASYRLFQARVRPLFPEFYDYKIAAWKSQGISPEQKVFEELQAYPKYRDAFLNAGKQLPIFLESSLTSFREEFPDFNPTVPADIIQSFDEMDGGTRVIEGKFYFVFGAESIAKFHRTQDFERKVPFLHHELFHVYHRAHFLEDETLLDGLWAEGLAVLAAQTLNPQAGMDQLSLDNPKGLMQECQRLKKSLLADLTVRLKNPDPEDYATYFYGSSKHPWIPRRAGYCMGYEIAKTAVQGTSLAALVKLDRKQVASKVESVLRYLFRGISG